MTRLSKQLRILVAGAVLALGAGAAYAGPFQVTPSGDGLDPSLAPFTADSMSGTSSTLIQFTGVSGGAAQYTATGYIDFSAFNLNSVPLGHTGLNDAYGMYAVFSQTFACPGALGTGVTCAATSINLSLYANPGDTDFNSFTSATLGGPAPTHSEISSSDILLGSANAIVAGGVAGINSLGGAFENINTDFSLTAAGSAFFTEPVPFYTIAFSEYNNTSTGLACNATGCAVNDESGLTDFNNAPEPASLAIFGLGLTGLAALRRRKAK